MSDTNINVDNTTPPPVVAVQGAALPLKRRLTSRKLWMVLFACSLPWFGLERGVNHLYALQEWQAAVYGTMFLAVMGVIGALVGKYMGIDAVSIGSQSNVVGGITAAATHAFERRETESIEKIIADNAEKYKDDESYRPIDPIR